MQRFLLAFLVLLVTAPAWAKPNSIVGASTSMRSTTTLRFLIGDTTESDAIGVSGFCTVRYQQASGDDVSLYAVPTPTTAASSGTLLNAFTASTTPASPAFTFTASTMWVKAVATDSTAGGSVLVIDCSPVVGSSSGGSGSFLAESYSAGSLTGGIAEAITACHNSGGGVVILPEGQTDIDADAIGETAEIFLLTENAADYEADCEIIGYGRSKPTEGGVDADFGSFIKITNADGNTGFRVVGNGQTLRDFTLQMTGTDASTIGIDISSDTVDGQTCDGTCAKGEMGLNEFLLSSVNVLGPNPTTHGSPAAGGPGVGINLTGLLKSRFEDSEIHYWDYGVQYTASSDASPPTPSNANTFTGVTFRKNDVGFRLADAYLCTDIQFVGNTLEGNTYGFHATSAVTGSNSQCVFSDFGGYWENDTHNIFLQGDQIALIDIGGVFSTTSAGDDVARDVVNAKKIPDILINARGAYGLTYTNGATAKVLGGMWNGFTSITAASIFGEIGVHATDCPGTYGTRSQYENKATRGDMCFEADSGTLWVCKPSGATDGQCDSAGDWVVASGANGLSGKYGNAMWGLSDASGAAIYDTGTEVCALASRSCQRVMEFSTPATPTSQTCATSITNAAYFNAYCY